MYITLMIISKKTKNILLFTLIIFIILSPVILPEFVKQRVKSTFVPYKTYTVLERQLSFDESSVIRIEAWKNSIERWAKRPVLGYGVLGGGGTIDSQYARVLIETGIAGFIAFIWLMVMIFRVGWQTYKAAEGNNFARGLSLGFIAGFAGLIERYPYLYENKYNFLLLGTGETWGGNGPVFVSLVVGIASGTAWGLAMGSKKTLRVAMGFGAVASEALIGMFTLLWIVNQT